MTDDIPALLEELKEVEPLLWDKITYLDQGDRAIKFAYQVLDDFALDHLQGCIQRAIEATRSEDFLRDLFWEIEMIEKDEYEASIYDRENLLADVVAPSPAAAILAAYVQAKRASK